MHTERHPHLNDVLIAAADLEDAEFHRDRLALACGAAIRQALAGGFTYAEIAQAANMTESEVRRHAEAPSVGPEVPLDFVALAAPSLAVHPSLSLTPSLTDGTRPQEDHRLVDLSGSASRDPDAAL
jgi:hypothetical protein